VHQETPRARPSVKLWRRSASTSRMTLAWDCDSEPLVAAAEERAVVGGALLFDGEAERGCLGAGREWEWPHGACDGLSLLTRFSDKKNRSIPKATA
jgi:hypothetical protein